MCYPFLDQYGFVKFDGAQQLSELTLDDRMPADQTNYEYTMSIWIKPSATSCVQANPYTAKESCFLAHLDGVFFMYQSSRNEVKVYFEALKNYYEASSKGVFIPIGQWVNIQLAFD
jgi:hypothetical protein